MGHLPGGLGGVVWKGGVVAGCCRRRCCCHASLTCLCNLPVAGEAAPAEDVQQPSWLSGEDSQVRYSLCAYVWVVGRVGGGRG